MFAATQKRRWIGRSAVAALVALAVAFLLLRESALARDAADGAYDNDCYGTLELRTGELFLGGSKRVRYTVERDEAGPYILPERFVGTWEDRGFEVDGTRAPMKLRLDALPRPSRIEVPAPRGSYSFERKAPRRIKLPG